MRGLNNELRSWAASELKYWEQAALEKVATRAELQDKDLQELVAYFIEDAGLAPIPSNRPRLSLFENVPPETQFVPCRLSRIFNLRNVNALPPGQEIHFGPQATLIYGNNGAGKSGYARALGSAGFARGERKVLPNATGTELKTKPQAEIEVLYSNEKRVVTWTEGGRCSELAGFYLFDGGSLTAHLTGSNSLSFTPAGLSVLTRLSELTDLIREEIRKLINRREQPHGLLAFFEGSSQVSAQIDNLNAQTDIPALDRLAELSPEEKTAFVELEREIAEIKLLDISKQLEKRRQEIRSISNLIQAILTAQTGLQESAAKEIDGLINEVFARRETAERSGATQFESESFSQIGTEAWRQFVTAARVLAEAEGGLGTPYPVEGDHCLLCRQALPNDAVALIQKLWLFLRSDAQAQLRRAEDACGAKIRDLERINLDYFSANSSARQILEEELKIIVSALDAQAEAFLERRAEMQRALNLREKRFLPPLIELDMTDLRKLVSIRRNEVDQLEKSDTEKRLATAERTLRGLKHKQVLRERMPEVITYVENRKWALRAEQSLGSTRTITTKYNELFQQLVTERYQKLFEETLKRFKKDINVTIETRGSKGETVRHVVLSPKSFRPGFSVDDILSEGEKRAVAMADFLTEAALDGRNSGIILDDPVTSLDDEWKKVLANCLAELARTRQVVVFTHDLTFLYLFKERADELTLDVVTHWIREEDGKPGFVYLGHSPVCEKDFRSTAIAREHYAKAKYAPPTEQQHLLQQGFGALRTSYEALIIFNLFNGVVCRFEERINFTQLKDVLVDQKVATEIINRMGIISRYINAHLHSDKFGSVKPSPEDLLEEINKFEIIRQTQKELKKLPDQPVSAKKDEGIRPVPVSPSKSVTDTPAISEPSIKPPAN